MQINRTPQITFGIKHSPLLGQLKPIEPLRSVEKQSVTKLTTTTHQKVGVPPEITQNNDIDVTESIKNYNDTGRRSVNESVDSSNINLTSSRTNVTHVRTQDEMRSTTVTPEPVQETLTQEIVWIPEKPARRGSYTIEKSDANGFIERYENNEIIPVENGAIRVSGRGERGASCNEERSSEVIEKEGYVQNVDKVFNNSKAHEKSQKATEEVRVGVDVQQLPNGGTSTKTTTTTVRKVGTAAKTVNAASTIIHTKTAVTSRDVGVK